MKIDVLEPIRYRLLAAPALPTPPIALGSLIFDSSTGIMNYWNGTAWIPLGGNAFVSAPFNVKSFGAIGDGIADDTAAINATIAAVPASGGYIDFPPGRYLISSMITVNKAVCVRGTNSISPDNAIPAPTEILKSAGFVGAYALLLTAQGSSVEGVGVNAQAGAAGAGIHILANSIALRDCEVFNQAGNGIDIGNPAGFDNVNSYYLERVICRGNGGHGLFVSSNVPGPPNANVGACMHCSFLGNGGDGANLDSVLFPLFFGCLYEGNTGWGIRGTALTQMLTIIGGDSEGNIAGQLDFSLTKLPFIQFPGISVVSGFEAASGADVIQRVYKHSFTAGAGSSTIVLGSMDSAGVNSGANIVAWYNHGANTANNFSFRVRNTANALVTVMDLINNGQVLIGPAVPGANPSLLELVSTTRGFLPPKMTTAEKNAIVGPVAGLIVFDTTIGKHFGYDGAVWQPFW